MNEVCREACEHVRNDLGHRSMAEEGIKKLLLAVGEDPEREGIKETPIRVVKAFREMTEGYLCDPDEILKTTSGSAFFKEEGFDQVIALCGIRFTSLCEHHLLPFSGIAHVGYLPREGKVAGVSKLARLVECFARRLQLQERMAQQIGEALFQGPLGADGAGVVIRAEHQCMACRGVRKPGAEMVTSVMLGAFRSNPAAREEFLELIRIRNG